jgi:transcriptional regulator with XRE-family HTH domain
MSDGPRFDPQPLAMVLGAARELVALSPRTVRERTGISGPTLWRIEQGLTHPKVGDVALLAALYGIPAQELLSLGLGRVRPLSGDQALTPDQVRGLLQAARG